MRSKNDMQISRNLFMVIRYRDRKRRPLCSMDGLFLKRQRESESANKLFAHFFFFFSDAVSVALIFSLTLLNRHPPHPSQLCKTNLSKCFPI